MRFIANILIWTALVALTVTGCRTIEDRGGYVRAEVSSIPWWTEHVVAATPLMIIRRSNAEHVVMDDAAELARLARLLDSARPAPARAYNDARIACVLFRPDGSTDTVGFGGYLTVNERVYMMDTTTLKLVAAHLSDEHQQIIEDEPPSWYRQGNSR